MSNGDKITYALIGAVAAYFVWQVAFRKDSQNRGSIESKPEKQPSSRPVCEENEELVIAPCISAPCPAMCLPKKR